MMQRPARRPWYQGCFVLNLAGGLILWACLPATGLVATGLACPLVLVCCH